MKILHTRVEKDITCYKLYIWCFLLKTSRAATLRYGGSSLAADCWLLAGSALCIWLVGKCVKRKAALCNESSPDYTAGDVFVVCNGAHRSPCQPPPLLSFPSGRRVAVTCPCAALPPVSCTLLCLVPCTHHFNTSFLQIVLYIVLKI